MTYRVRILAGGLLTLAAASCSDSPTSGPADPIRYAVSPARQWSGGTVILRSSQANGGHAARLVLAGGDSVLATAVDDTTYTFSLPTGPSGSLAILVSNSGGNADSAGQVDRVGFVGVSELPEMYWGMRAWRPGGHPAVLGILQTSTIASIDLESGTLTQFPNLTYVSELQYGIYPTDSADTFVLRDQGSGAIGIWRMAPSVYQLDTVPWFVTLSARQAVRLSSDVWLMTSHHMSWTMIVSDSSRPWEGNGESPWEFYLSPDGQIATMGVSAFPDGSPVLNTQTGDTLYTLSLIHVKRAAFSSDSRVLFALGGARYDLDDSLIAVDARTGARLAGAQLPDSAHGYNFVLNSAGDRIYLDTQINDSLYVLVYAASNLQLIGQLPTGELCPLVSTCSTSGTMLEDPASHRLYVVRSGSPAIRFSFELLP